MQIWDKARIPTTQLYNVINRIKELHDKWTGLKKSINRRTPKQLENEEKFKEPLNDLFDVAHADALEMISIQKDRDFLLAQGEKGKL